MFVDVITRARGGGASNPPSTSGRAGKKLDIIENMSLTNLSALLEENICFQPPPPLIVGMSPKSQVFFMSSLSNNMLFLNQVFVTVTH